MATAISAITIGVGSLPNVPSALSSPFSPAGSVPLSLSSMAMIGLPLASTNGLPFSLRAAPIEVAWFSSPVLEVPPASGSIVTVNTTSKVSLTCSGPVLVMSDIVVSPSQNALATGAEPVPVKFCTARLLGTIPTN